jgi:hypothetical protein
MSANHPKRTPAQVPSVGFYPLARPRRRPDGVRPHTGTRYHQASAAEGYGLRPLFTVTTLALWPAARPVRKSRQRAACGSFARLKFAPGGSGLIRMGPAAPVTRTFCWEGPVFVGAPVACAEDPCRPGGKPGRAGHTYAVQRSGRAQIAVDREAEFRQLATMRRGQRFTVGDTRRHRVKVGRHSRGVSGQSRRRPVGKMRKVGGRPAGFSS